VKQTGESRTKNVEKKAETEEKSGRKEEGAQSEKAESDEIEAQKQEIIKEQLEEESADLKNTLDISEPGSPEHIEAAALLAFTEQLNQKLENPDAETDP